jgi:16S rRNA G966 N2-methylase RsmD
MEGRLDLLLKPGLDIESPGKVVVDLGCGTGVLGLYALSKGAKFVYFVEQDNQMVHILKNVLPKKIPNGNFKIIHKDIEHLKLSDFEEEIPEVIVSEFYGPRLFDEGYVTYARHIKKLFTNCRFIPEEFKGTFYFIDIDYNQPIWPNDKDLIDYFKFMYKEKGFARYIDTPENKTLVGTIQFDANTGYFDNNLEFNYPFSQDKLLLGVMSAEYGKYVHHYTTIGWVFTNDEYGKKFRIKFDEFNYYNPIKVHL